MSTDLNSQVQGIKDDYKYGFRDSDEHYSFKSRKGLDRHVVEEISAMKDEPQWMRELRLKALEVFWAKPTPTWGGSLSELNYDDIHYYMRAADRQGVSWDDIPADIKKTYDRLGIPEAEKRGLIAGVGAQYESEVVYHSLRDDLAKKGVIFVDTDTA
jgi:Fe-S cluster assembly protein SufB